MPKKNSKKTDSKPLFNTPHRLPAFNDEDQSFVFEKNEQLKKLYELWNQHELN